MGRHGRPLRHYVGRHQDALTSIPVAVFQVSLASAEHDEEHDAEAHSYLDQLLEGTGLRPEAVGLFAGALAYTEYGWITRRVMRSIAAHEGHSTDTSSDHDDTDGDAVDAFAADVLRLARARVAATG